MWEVGAVKSYTNSQCTVQSLFDQQNNALWIVFKLSLSA